LRDADGGGAGRPEIGWQTEVVEGEEAVVARDGQETGGTEPLIEGVGEGIGDPVQVWVPRAVVEGENEQDVSPSLLFVRLGTGLGAGLGARGRK
jgi:hypothetical protein